jgi:uncharacterized membrane protein YphA (DoxX/SURF4 family)
MQGDTRQLIRRGLLALRLALGASILFWGIVALEGPARGRILFAHLPGVTVEPQAAILIAVGEIALGVFIAMGLLRGLSYGVGFFCQAVAVFAIPVLVAHALLFVLRSEDRLFAVDSMLTAGRRPPAPLQLAHLQPAKIPEMVD